MNVKNIVMQNMVLQANHGLDMTEGSGIILRNVTLHTKQTDPVLNIHNSQDIQLVNIKYMDASEVLLNVSGDKSKTISLSATDVNKAKKAVDFTYGANKGAVKMN